MCFLGIYKIVWGAFVIYLFMHIIYNIYNIYIYISFVFCIYVCIYIYIYIYFYTHTSDMSGPTCLKIHHPWKKKRFHCRGVIKCKKVSVALHEKQQKKRLPHSMGSNISQLTTPKRKTHCSKKAVSPQRYIKNDNFKRGAARGKKKKVPTQHGHHIPRFCNTPKRFVEATLEGQFCRRRVARNLVQVCAAAPAARRTLFATLMRWMPLSAQTCSKSWRPLSPQTCNKNGYSHPPEAVSPQYAGPEAHFYWKTKRLNEFRRDPAALKSRIARACARNVAQTPSNYCYYYYYQTPPMMTCGLLHGQRPKRLR